MKEESFEWPLIFDKPDFHHWESYRIKLEASQNRFTFLLYCLHTFGWNYNLVQKLISISLHCYRLNRGKVFEILVFNFQLGLKEFFNYLQVSSRHCLINRLVCQRAPLFLSQTEQVSLASNTYCWDI